MESQVATLIVVLAVAACSAHWQPDDRKTCKRNLHDLFTALESYASDWQGRYPDRLDRLLPVYLKKLPTCSADGRCSYLDYRSRRDSFDFRFSCDLPDHRQLDLHADSSEHGLPDRP